MLGVSLALIGTAALGAGGFRTQECAISGAGQVGTLIVFPAENRGEYTVEIERNGQVLVSSGLTSDHQLARDPSPAPGDGEVWRALHNGVVVDSGIGQGYGCDGGTTVPPTTTEPPEETTTTTGPPRPPIDGCDKVECPEPPSVTTTTIPGQPGTVDCPNGQNKIGEDADGNALCEATSQGG